MGAGIIKAAIDMIKSLSDLSTKVIEAGDPEKYVESVEKLHQGVDKSYAMMRDIVEKDTELSTEEKLNKLKEIAESEQQAKEKCGEALDGHREKTAKITLDVLKGFLTCGLSFTPAIIKNIKKALEGKDVPDMIDVEPGDSPNLIDEQATEE